MPTGPRLQSTGPGDQCDISVGLSGVLRHCFPALRSEQHSMASHNYKFDQWSSLYQLRCDQIPHHVSDSQQYDRGERQGSSIGGASSAYSPNKPSAYPIIHDSSHRERDTVLQGLGGLGRSAQDSARPTGSAPDFKDQTNRATDVHENAATASHSRDTLEAQKANNETVRRIRDYICRSSKGESG